jgi:8-oxo-dGTP pyrophosphatase MutT (NUDIX family)
MPGPRKACPVLVRRTARGLEVLAFHHPLAGTQLVKGTIEPGETIEDAAVRELREESGIVATAISYLGTLEMCEPAQEWHLVICEAGSLPEGWRHRTSDGGGLDFSFFWHPLQREPDASWHPVFKRALVFINQHLGS